MMAEGAFYWIGVGVVATVAFATVAFVLLFLYVKFLHGRFGLILFRKSERRLSLASWYNAKLMSDEFYHADDWPIGKRPFYISYEVGNRRAFLMLGMLGPRRDMPISGEHPEQAHGR